MNSHVLVSEAIDDYTARGWSVIPIRTRDKRPLVRWQEFQYRRPRVEEVHAWFSDWPEAGLASSPVPFPASSCSILIPGTAAI